MIPAGSIYYGDEIGLEGEKDPDNRRAFPWDETEWNTDLRNYVQKLIAVRKAHVALRRGDLQQVYLSDEPPAYAFSRTIEEETILIVVNPSEETHHLRIPCQALGWADGQAVKDLLSNKRYTIVKEVLELTLSPWSGAMVG
jgi:glycosidase